MKGLIFKITIMLICSCCIDAVAIAQAKFAGSFKTLIGQKYKYSSDLKILKGYTFFQGDVISDINDPDQLTSDVYKKGNTTIVFFSKKIEGDSLYQVYDVLEIKDAMKGWEIKIATCSDNHNPNVEIVALVRSTNAEVAKVIKRAWRFNRDKIRFEQIPTKGIECINEGQD